MRRARQAMTPEPGARVPEVSGSELARRLGWNQAKVSLIEAGRQTPTVLDVQAWAEVTGADVAALLDERDRSLTRTLDIRAAARIPGGVDALQGDLETIEAASTSIAEYQPTLVPGLAQTPAYTRAWINQPGRVDLGGPADAEDVVRYRADRQRRLHGRALTVAVPSAVLAAVYGTGRAGVATQRAQLDALTTAATGGGIELIVATRPLAILHGFELLDDAVIIETVAGGHVLADPGIVEQFRGALAWLRRHGATGARALREVTAARAALPER
jgi:transcriptional regulator with XRE-family HTH domain